MSPSPPDLLRHILAEVEFLLAEARQVSRDEFLGDPALRRAFVRSLEIIGEAAKLLPKEFRDASPDIPWAGMAGMRDRLIHHYFGVDYELVWDVVAAKVPPLARQIQELLAGIEES